MKISISWKRVAWGVILISGFIILAYVLASHRNLPIPRGTDRWFYGNIIEGEKFGFQVGAILDDNLESNSSTHSSSLKYYGKFPCKGTYRIVSECSNKYRHASFGIRKFLYYGQVFVEYDDRNVIRSIVWNADAVPMEWIF